MKPSSTPAPPHSHTPAPLITGGVLIALTLTRWLVPTEATAEGETLWIAGLWLLAGTFFCLWPNGWSFHRRWDLADAGVVLLIGGHVCSGLLVLATAGDRRMAINLLWEWLSLGVFWFAWRAALADRAMRQTIVPVLTTTAVTLALWGLYQYFLWYPQLKAEYLPLIDQFRQQQAAGVHSAEIVRKLSEAGIPVEEPGLTLFLNRLRDSREPFGPFALANTFGGLLAASLVILVGVLLQRVPAEAFRNYRSRDAKFHAGGAAAAEKTESRTSDLLLAVGAVLIAACLYLTNSRTAWGGVFAGASVGCVLAISQCIKSEKFRRLVFPLATLIGVLSGIGLLVLISNDVHDVPGPLKSLAYRAEYWRGTMALLLTSPWRGAGLAQFRDKYLMFKVPESSEEIADPHNLFLDVWANGGLIALAGLCLLLIVVWHRLWNLSRREVWGCGGAGVENGITSLPPPYPHTPAPPHQQRETHPRSHSWLIPGLAAFAIVMAGQLYSTGVWDAHIDRLVVFAVIWGVVAWAVSQGLDSEDSDSSRGALIGVVVLSVHLLGAGGIAMPAVTQLWLLLIAWGTTSASDAIPLAPRLEFRPFRLLIALVCLLLFAGWYITAERPVRLARLAMEQGDRVFGSRGDAEQAKVFYQTAASSDPWAPEPWMRLANAALSQGFAGRPEQSRSRWTQAIEEANTGIRLAPFRPLLLIQRADWLREIARRTRELSDWIAASDAYRAAASRHPTNAALLANLAIALSQSGSQHEAIAMARRAQLQEELNRQRGHTDRYLPDEVLQQLQGILAVPSPE